MPDGKLDGRIALVTGSSRGIGRAIALRYAREGAHVIAVSRTQGALEELDDEILAMTGDNATLVPADLTDYDVIDRMGASIFERFGKLDILVGNAALLTRLTPLAQMPPSDWDISMATNLTSNFRLIRSFDPLLKMSDAGRAIFVTSIAAVKNTAYWGAYSVSKAALESMVKTYAAENAKTNICANLLDPGATRTVMRALAFPGEKPDSLKPPEDVTDLAVDLALPTCLKNGDVVRHEN